MAQLSALPGRKRPVRPRWGRHIPQLRSRKPGRTPRWRLWIKVRKVFLVAWKATTIPRVLLAAFGLPLLLYIWREVTRDVLIIDPLIVPKQLSESGLTPEAMAALVGDRMRQIETSTRTIMKKDQLTMVPDSPPSIEVPGTRFDLKAVVEMTRAVFGVYPRHIGGVIVFLPASSLGTGTDSAKRTARVMIFVTEGQKLSPAVSENASADDVDGLVQVAAEAALGQVNPYVLGSYDEQHRRYDQATGLAGEILQNRSAGPLYRAAAANLIGNVLSDEKKYDEAIAEYREALEIDPRLVLAWSNWGRILVLNKRYDEGIAKYQKATEIDPNFAIAWNNWGAALHDEKKGDEAIAKYRKALEIEPNYALAWDNWGDELYQGGKLDEAIAKFQKATEVDPDFAAAWSEWGLALYYEKKYDEAIAKFQKATEIDPNGATAWYGWGSALDSQTKYDQAAVKFQKVTEINPSDAAAWNNWGSALDHENKYDEAIPKYRKAIEIDPKLAVAWYNCGVALEKLGRTTEADENFARARALGHSG